MTDEIRAFVVMADAYDQLPSGSSAAGAGGIAVTADPQLATEMHRSALAGVYMELMKDPLVNPMEVRKRLFQVLRLPNPELLIGQPPQPQATPKEQADIAVKMHELQTKRTETAARIILMLSQARESLVKAASGTVDIRMSLLQMAQLENTVQEMLMGGDGGAQSGPNGMAGAPGNPGASPALPPPGGGDGGAVPPWAAGGPGDAGAGDGLPPVGNPADSGGA
jgi:hypothetical protein